MQKTSGLSYRAQIGDSDDDGQILNSQSRRKLITQGSVAGLRQVAHGRQPDSCYSYVNGPLGQSLKRITIGQCRGQGIQITAGFEEHPG
jgi:hypothetical protein